MSDEWDTLSKSGTILLKAARLLALSIHRLSATTGRIFLVGPPLLVALPSIGRLVILNVGDKREKREGGKGSLALSWNRNRTWREKERMGSRERDGGQGRELELEMGGQAPFVRRYTGGTIVAFGQIINPEVLTFFAS